VTVEALLGLSWRAYPALVLAVGGALLVVRGVRSFLAARGEGRDPERALRVARAGRVVILGLCLATFAGAWLAQIAWLAGLALIVVAEEMLETSFMIATLEDGRRRAAR
jgi:hypothetical protein